MNPENLHHNRPPLILDPVAACLAFGPPDEVAAGAGAQVAHAMAQIGSREEDRVPRAAGGVEHLRRWEPCRLGTAGLRSTELRSAGAGGEGGHRAGSQHQL